MYVFVRFTAVIFIILGIILLLGGFGLGLYGVTQFFAAPASSGALPPIMAPGWISVMGNFAAAILLFIQGLLIAALGQLMLVFIDIARNTQETVYLLQRTRS